MDPIAHTFVGGALAQAGLRERSRYATAALVIGANLPDIDGVAMFLGSDQSLWWRRGWTHGFPALFALPILLTGAFLLWDRLVDRRESTPTRPGALLALSYLAVWTHPSLDWMNNYGMRWLMPLDGTWFYGDTLFIVDLWIWTALGGALFLFHSRRAVSVLAWCGFAGFGALLLYSTVQGLLAAKLAWGAALVGLVWLRSRGHGFEPASARRWARGALALVCVYIAGMNLSVHYVRGQVTRAMLARGVVIERMMVGPLPVTPFSRDIVVQSSDGYRYGRVELVPRFELSLTPTVLPKLADSELIRRATSSPEVRGFMNWARFPFAEVEEHADGDGYTIYLQDARYTRSRGAGFGSARVVVPAKSGSDPN